MRILEHFSAVKMVNYIKNILIIIIVLYVSIIENADSGLFLKISKYRLFESSYINGVFFKKHNKYIMLHCYSKAMNMKLSNCILVYNRYTRRCNAVLNKIPTQNRSLFMIKVSTNSCLKPRFIIINNLTIKIPHPLQKRFKYVVCARMIFNYTRSNYLVQHFESLKYFGVSKVVSYYTSSTAKVLKILKYYVKSGILDLYKYDSEMENVWKSIYYGEVAKLNHCFHQYQEVSDYIIESDYDELLWPNEGRNYDDIFSKLPRYDVYFTHTRFFPINPTIIDDKNRSNLLLDVDMFNVNHSSCQTYNGISRKYIISNPTKLLALEVHFIVYPQNITVLWINTSIAYLRHTRQITYGILKACKKYYTHSKSKIIKEIEINSNIIKKMIF